MHQGLGGDTAAVETGAAGLTGLKERDFLTELSGLDRGGKTAGTGADDKQIVLHGTDLQFD